MMGEGFEVVTSLAKQSLKSPMGECLVIRYAVQVLVLASWCSGFLGCLCSWQALLAERDAQVEKILLTCLHFLGYLVSKLHRQ